MQLLIGLQYVHADADDRVGDALPRQARLAQDACDLAAIRCKHVVRPFQCDGQSGDGLDRARDGHADAQWYRAGEVGRRR